MRAKGKRIKVKVERQKAFIRPHFFLSPFGFSVLLLFSFYLSMKTFSLWRTVPLAPPIIGEGDDSLRGLIKLSKTRFWGRRRRGMRLKGGALKFPMVALLRFKPLAFPITLPFSL
jgi:hypothetical protein